ncbi:MAG: DUF5107 domain-containing protein [Acidobacteriia bacterium]|nr:DUF5107 domain-containing protein [Terriglobia bacterium]
MYASRLIPIALLLCLRAAPGEVRVWQGTLPLPTTMEGPPDPNPPFDVFATTRFNYPYTLRQNLTDERKEIAWRALFLENEYLKCSVLPDVGGHLYTCIDKISGHPMFYANPSIKKAQIGYRGAWAAFGIEFNFPVSHNWVSMSPVDFSFRSNPDGSASVFVGNIDRPYGMQWTVELKLRPGSTLLEQRVTLYNRSDVRHRFYWWNNAGVRVWDDSRICYPMRWTASHGFTQVDTWPVDSSGTDLSVIRNQVKGPVSLFVHGSREPFMGVYHPHTQTGIVHYADFAELPAKKFWSWGVDADGLDWRRALSDDNSGYVEVQAGLMRNQETYAFLDPRQTIQFSEFWMPVRGLGGIARANLAGVVNLRRESGKLIAGLNVNSAIPGATVRLLDGSQQLYEATADLRPEASWSHEMPAPSGRPITFELRTADGSVLLRHTEGAYDWSPETEIRTGPQPRSPLSDPLEAGQDQELNGRLLVAYDTYTGALEKSPGSLPLALAAGRLAASLLRYQDAVRWLLPAQTHATYDPEIAYYLGVAMEGLGRPGEAQAQFETAHRMPAFHAAGSLRLGELAARRGDLAQAERYLHETLRSAPDDERAMEELSLVEQALHHPVDVPQPPLSQLRPEAISSDPERVLAVAGLYMRLGLWRDALNVLSRDYPDVPAEQKEPGAPLPRNHPVVAYYRAFCREKLGESAAADYAAASRVPAAYVFPSGAQALEVLEATVRAQPADAKAHFLLGSLRLASGLVDEAIAEWKTARQSNAGIPVLDASLGKVLLRIKHDPQAASEAFRAGLAADAGNTDLYTGLDEALSILGRPPAERITVLERYPDPPHMPVPLVYDLALSYAEASRFDQAKALFQNRFFPREEGGTNVRQVWVRVRALEAQWNATQNRCPAALEIVDRLNDPTPGLAFTRDGLDGFIAEPANQSALGLVESRCGRSSAAERRLETLTARNDPASVAFAYELARRLPGFRPADWSSRLAAASRRADANAAGGAGWAAAIAGLLHLRQGQTDEAARLLQSAVLTPDRNLAHHHSRTALTEMSKR